MELVVVSMATVAQLRTTVQPKIAKQSMVIARPRKERELPQTTDNVGLTMARPRVHLGNAALLQVRDHRS